MAKTQKTNVMRLLDQAKIPYTHQEYDISDGLIDGVSVAQKLGQDPARCFKTLVARGHSGAYHVFLLPGPPKPPEKNRWSWCTSRNCCP